MKKFNGVIVGKLTGQLQLKANEIAWKDKSNTSPINVKYKDIVKHMVAARGDSFLLKIIVEDNKSFIFTFNNVNDREAARDHLTLILQKEEKAPQRYKFFIYYSCYSHLKSE